MAKQQTNEVEEKAAAAARAAMAADIARDEAKHKALKPAAPEPNESAAGVAEKI